MSEQMDTLQQYVSDMLAVEREIHEAIRIQEEDENVARFTEAQSVISRAEAVLDNHIAALEEHLEQLGGDAASPVKDAVASVLGVAAGLYGKVRGEKVSKMLRDDYTALSLAAISYHMLHTTGLALQSQSTASLALRHLMDWTPIVTELSHTVHKVVVAELEGDGFGIDSSVAQESERMTQEAWDPKRVS